MSRHPPITATALGLHPRYSAMHRGQKTEVSTAVPVHVIYTCCRNKNRDRISTMPRVSEHQDLNHPLLICVCFLYWNFGPNPIFLFSGTVAILVNLSKTFASLNSFLHPASNQAFMSSCHITSFTSKAFIHPLAGVQPSYNPLAYVQPSYNQSLFLISGLS